MTSQLPPPKWIDDQAGFERLLGDLSGQRQIAVDTEANSFFNYRERVCLVQLTVEDRDYLLDPLAELDLTGLGQVLADPAREKIFHDGEYDIMILKREYGFEFANLFDTRVAAAALGEANPGLATVLKTRFGVELDKSMQRSNWSERPLSAKQVSYARFDTRYLIPLAEGQKKELERLGRRRVVDGECRRLEQLVPPEQVFNPDEYLRIRGARALSPLQHRILRELFILRDRLCAKADVPPFKILSNAALMDVTRSRPRSMKELGGIQGFSPRQLRRLGADVLEAIRVAVEAGPLDPIPKLPPKDGVGHLGEIEYELHERLKSWRRDRAQGLGYDASLVINRHVLVRIAQAKPQNLDQMRAVDGLLDWQVEDFGVELIELVRSSLEEFRGQGTPRRRRFQR